MVYADAGRRGAVCTQDAVSEASLACTAYIQEEPHNNEQRQDSRLHAKLRQPYRQSTPQTPLRPGERVAESADAPIQIHKDMEKESGEQNAKADNRRIPMEKKEHKIEERT